MEEVYKEIEIAFSDSGGVRAWLRSKGHAVESNLELGVWDWYKLAARILVDEAYDVGWDAGCEAGYCMAGEIIKKACDDWRRENKWN